MVYPRRGLPLAIELVNTQFAMAGQPQDGLRTPHDLEDWLKANAAAFGDLALPPPSETLLDQLRTLRSALRTIFSAHSHNAQPRADAVAALNMFVAAAPRVSRLDWDAKGPHVRSIDLAEQSETVALAAVGRSALELIASEPADAKVGQCQAPGCVLFFLRDARRKNWCSAACGNRGRVARHYHRQHGNPTPSTSGRGSIQG